jgi:hypothetical protein
MSDSTGHLIANSVTAISPVQNVRDNPGRTRIVDLIFGQIIIKLGGAHK